MSSQTVLVCFGTRPEVIKLAPVVFALEAHPSLDPVVVTTAQHRSMLDQMLESFGLKPEVDLNLMRADQSLANLTGAAVPAMADVIRDLTPRATLVQGDTTTAMAAALASFYAGVPVGHVEAGLRTNDPYNPFPEEINRRVIGTMARWHYCPTGTGRTNLQRENVSGEIHVTGNTVIDALFWIRERQLRDGYNPTHLPTQQRPRRVLVTLHRRETHGEVQRELCRALAEVTRAHGDVEVVFPVHLSPRVRAEVIPTLRDVSHVHLIDPVSYEDFAYLMSTAYVIVSDSGGVQEEAPSLDVPVLVLRETTERPDGIEAGGAILCGVHPDGMRQHLDLLLADQEVHRRMARSVNPYGDGHAARRIVQLLARALGADESVRTDPVNAI